MRGSTIKTTSSRVVSSSGLRHLCTRHSSRPAERKSPAPHTPSISPRRNIFGLFRSKSQSPSSSTSASSAFDASSSSARSGTDDAAGHGQTPEMSTGARNKALIASRLKQDPFGRIRVIRPYGDKYQVIQDLYRMARLNPTLGINGNIREYEAHCLPFWTMIFMADMVEHGADRLTGRRLRLDYCLTDTGCSVAAVPEGHWAHGVVLPDGVRNMYETLEEYGGDSDRNRYGFRLESMITEHDFTPQEMPEFAMGYPKLPEGGMGRVMGPYREKVYRKLYPKTDPWITFSDRRPLEYAAIPTYRIVYKLRLANGKQAYWDGQYLSHTGYYTGRHQDPAFGFTLRDRPPQYPIDHPHPGDFFHVWADERDTTASVGARGSSAAILAIESAVDHEDFHAWADLYYGGMMRSRLDWCDPMIIPADTEGSNNVRSVVKYAYQRLLKLPMSKRPQWEACIPATLRSLPSTPRPSIPLPTLPARRTIRPETHSSASENSASKLSAKTSPTTPYSSRTPPRPPPRPVPPVPRPPPPPAIKIPAPNDPLDFYAQLEVDVDPVYLDPRRENEANRLLKNAKIVLNKMNHPDKTSHQSDGKIGAGGGETANEHMSLYKRRQDKTAAINRAFDALETLAHRQYYQQHGEAKE